LNGQSSDFNRQTKSVNELYNEIIEYNRINETNKIKSQDEIENYLIYNKKLQTSPNQLDIFQDLFNSIVASYLKLSRKPTRYEDMLTFTMNIFEYYREANNNNNITVEDIMRHEEIGTIIKDYAKSKSGFKYLEQDFNRLLNQVGYKYKVKFLEPDFIKFTIESDQDREVKLSTGEAWMLNILALQYKHDQNQNGFSFSDKVEYILLDEPDRHFDPKLSKQLFEIIDKVFLPNNIKVFMTTHRADTVSLANSKSVFKMNQVT
jgi:AAA15 family ATPase/GTPase